MLGGCDSAVRDIETIPVNGRHLMTTNFYFYETNFYFYDTHLFFNHFNYFVKLRITDGGSVPEMRIWSI